MIVGSTISHYKIVEKLGRTVALKFLAQHLLDNEEVKARSWRHYARESESQVQSELEGAPVVQRVADLPKVDVSEVYSRLLKLSVIQEIQ